MAVVARYAAQCIGYFQTIKISDVVDMLIIAFVLYKVFLLVRKTQAGKVFKGVLLLLVGLAVSYQFNLHVMSFILNKTVEIGFLALVVLFQPEIRRFLEQMGGTGLGKLFGGQSKSPQLEQTILQTVDAFRAMSKERIGALVVFERANLMDDYMKSGTELDAAVSSELLQNIFWPKAPLHDGAVVVRGARIVSAGCVLPLTANTNISRELGTRHRAAIGVSEHTDAISAVISEETGAISVAVGGMLKRHLTLDTLEQLLRNELMPAEENQRRSKFNGLFKKKEDGNRVE